MDPVILKMNYVNDLNIIKTTKQLDHNSFSHCMQVLWVYQIMLDDKTITYNNNFD